MIHISFFTFAFLVIFCEIHSLILPDLSHTWVFYTSHMPVSQPLITFSHLYLPTLTFFTFQCIYCWIGHVTLGHTLIYHCTFSISLLWPLYKIQLLYSVGFQPNLTICFQISSPEFQQLITNHLALTLLLMIKSGFQICNHLHILRCTQVFFPKVRTVQQAGSPVNGALHLLRLTHSWRTEVLLNSGFLPRFHWAYSGIWLTHRTYS